MNICRCRWQNLYLFLYLQIGCCGADGSDDYISLRQPLPSTCRNTITGNPFYYGCVDELTWLLEDKSGWVAGLAMTLGFIQVSLNRCGFEIETTNRLKNIVNSQIANIALSLILVQALKREEEEAANYPK